MFLFFSPSPIKHTTAHTRARHHVIIVCFALLSLFSCCSWAEAAAQRDPSKMDYQQAILYIVGGEQVQYFNFIHSQCLHGFEIAALGNENTSITHLQALSEIVHHTTFC